MEAVIQTGGDAESADLRSEATSCGESRSAGRCTVTRAQTLNRTGYMPNRLANETSPYLLQHANNPVDWYPWGEEALARARSENKPILLSIGYAACHWCHVMERESFEDDSTAELMNRHFVSIKVDREERPDLDSIYMTAVQAMTGHGGWPMTVFLTPGGLPFFGGTYYPPEDRHGMPSFRRVLTSIADAYANRPDDVDRTTAKLRELYDRTTAPRRTGGALDAQLLERAYRAMAQHYDVRHGGFDGAPKFPQVMSLDFLLRYWRRTGTAYALEMAHTSFRRMVQGGIHDQVGGGFHRYTVDANWLVPHFEKMLYDNALLARLGAHLWQATGDVDVRDVTERLLAWISREMTSSEGGFFSSLDADSEGEEGRYYLWDHPELEELLGDDSALAALHWGATPTGNFEGRNILHVSVDTRNLAARAGVDEADVRRRIDSARTRLMEARERRVRPGLDDKVLAGWNGLMLRGVAESARAFEDSSLRSLALRNGEFLFARMVNDGRVMRSRKDGQTRITGFLEDHAAVALGALALYELTLDRIWFDRALELGDSMVEWFWDDAAGAFFDTARDHESLITRPCEVTDNALPSGTSLATELLLRLAELTQDADRRRRATYVLETLAEPMARHALAFGHMLGAADLAIHGAVEVAIAGAPEGEDTHALLTEISRRYVPSLVLAGGEPGSEDGIALLASRPKRDDRATAYVCRGYSCQEPTTDPLRLGEQLEEAVRNTAPPTAVTDPRSS